MSFATRKNPFCREITGTVMSFVALLCILTSFNISYQKNSFSLSESGVYTLEETPETDTVYSIDDSLDESFFTAFFLSSLLIHANKSSLILLSYNSFYIQRIMPLHLLDIPPPTSSLTI